MAQHPLQSIIPMPDLAPEEFKGHQLAYEFRHERKQRQRFEDYCRWYEQIATQHQQELEMMRSEFNLFRWFCRGSACRG